MLVRILNKVLCTVLLLSILFIPALSEAANKFWWAPCLTASSTCLDGIDGASLTAGDAALVVWDSGSTTPIVYIYRLYESSADEASPTVISPDTNPGTKRWHLVRIVGTAFATPDGTTGVLITASDGKITLTGQGDGYDEAITFDLDTYENEVRVTSTTGVVKFNFASIATIAKEVVVAGGTCSTSYAINPANGTMFTLTLNGACEIQVTGLAAGMSFTVQLTQSSTTAPTFTTAYTWPGGTDPTWSTVATRYDVFSCASFDGTTLRCNGMVNMAQ